MQDLFTRNRALAAHCAALETALAAARDELATLQAKITELQAKNDVLLAENEHLVRLYGELALQVVELKKRLSESRDGGRGSPPPTRPRSKRKRGGRINSAVVSRTSPRGFNRWAPSGWNYTRIDAPALIFGLFGGVSEWTLGGPRPYAPIRSRDLMCSEPARPGIDGVFDQGVVRGAAWYQSSESLERHLHGSTRSSYPMLRPGFSGYVQSPRIGFRCMRWVPDPR